MLPLSYNISFELKKNLDAIDSLRQKILLTPISPRYENKLRWDYSVKKLRYTSLLRGHDLSPSTVVKLISHTAPVTTTRAQQDLVNYKQALDYITEEWIANTSPVTVRVIRGLSNMVAHNPQTNNVQFAKAEESLKHMLDYLQTRPEHPIILSGIAYIKILDIMPNVQNNDLLAQLTAILLLYKNGFEIKQLINFEEYWHKNLRTFRSVINEVMTKGKLTMWLEYYAYSIALQLTKISQLIDNPPSIKDPANRMWRLTQRQKDILHKLDEPGTTITNRNVQKIFGISQITASRDLAKLAGLGLLLTHGKGRSVYYIKS